jgi:putative ABC transport system permease protein
MVGYFGFIAIVIACLGLLGLSSYLTEQRRKEVGIRKVLGASAMKILAGYAGSFLKLVLIANVLAIPVIWYGMSRWLERFAYRIDVRWSVFALAFCLSVLIAFITISIQVYRASRANPVESLKAE